MLMFCLRNVKCENHSVKMPLNQRLWAGQRAVDKKYGGS